MVTEHVQLVVNADTSSVQSQFQALQTTLSKISNTQVVVQGGSIDTAVQSAKLLNEHLSRAVNVNTGRIDFSALTTSLKAANTDLITLSNNLLSMGPKGQQAFSQIAGAVARAELYTKKTNTALQKMGITLMNTLKWQVASSLIHGVVGAFQSAIGHIEKLDKALNNIQIVTQKSAAQMANFANKASELSKALSTTTDEYARAALIFFQQGLGEEAVIKRTEATLKMAKVTGDSVQEVSNQLTAIWNNFDNGTQSLESYVDVITALGAATASSTAEIAEGLEKFAAIAETVGLSYNYAATALATVTAETRQSADIVGTAFKTLFARIEGLKLGETLDDGVSLNRYSEALASVGVNILSANGDLKDMNIILDQVGEKWSSIGREQQVALAQTVGGIRQYNQFIALMDNWDTFKINLEVAEDSKGTLDEQFEVYQSGVEASKTKLQQAKDALYEELLNPNTLKGFNDVLSQIVDTFKDLVEDAGGLGEILQFGGLLLLKTVLPHLEGFLLRSKNYILDAIGYTQTVKLNTVGDMAQTQHQIAGTASPEKNSGFMPNTQGIGTVTDGSQAQMRTQMIKEEAGYTATILDTKKSILALEQGLTEKQKAYRKSYEDQIAQEQESLRIAREKQIVSKNTADQSKKSAALAVGGSQAGRELKETQRQAQLDQLEKERKQAKSNLTGSKESIAKQQSAIDKDYNKRQQDILNTQFNNKQLDFKGKETQSMVEGFKDSGISRTGQVMTQDMTAGLTQSADGSGPAASVENLEKLGTLQAQYTADLNKANGIYTEIGNNITNATNRTTTQKKALDQTSKTINSMSTTTQKGLVLALEESAQEMEKMGQNASGLRSQIKNLSKDGGKINLGALNKQELTAVQGAVGKVSTGLTEAGNSAGALVDAMSADMSKATGKNAEMYQGVAQNAQNAKSSAIEADEAAQRLQNTLNKKPPIIKDPFGSVVQGAQKAVSAFTSFAMGTQMLSTGIQQAFSKDATAVQQLMGAMMILQGVMSTLNAVKAVGNIVDTIAVAITAAKTAATNKENVVNKKNTGNIIKNTFATITNAAAKIFQAEASKGVAGVIAGVLAIALMTATVATVANTIATKKATEAAEANADAKEKEAASAKELADSTREELKAAVELVDAYRELYDIYEETGNGKDELIAKGEEVVKALDIENGSLILLQGNYERLMELMDQYAKKKSGEAISAGKTSVAAAGTDFSAKANMDDTGGIYSKTIQGTRSLAIQLGRDTQDEAAVKDYLEANPGLKWKLDAKYLYAPYQSDAEIPFLLKELQSIKIGAQAIAAEKNYKTENQEFFSEIAEMEDSGEAEKMTGAIEAYDSMIDTSIISSKSINLKNINNQSDYDLAYGNLVKDTFNAMKNIYGRDIDQDSNEGLAIIEAINKNLAEDEKYQDYELTRVGMEELKNLNENIKSYVESGKLKEWAVNHDYEWDEASSLLLTISPELVMNEDQISDYLTATQAYLDGQTLSIQFETQQSMKNDLKEDLSGDDFDAYWDSHSKELEAVGYTKNSFRAMSSTQRGAIIDSLVPDQGRGYDTKLQIAGKKLQNEMAKDSLIDYENSQLSQKNAFKDPWEYADWYTTTPEVREPYAYELDILNGFTLEEWMDLTSTISVPEKKYKVPSTFQDYSSLSSEDQKAVEKIFKDKDGNKYTEAMFKAYGVSSYGDLLELYESYKRSAYGQAIADWISDSTIYDNNVKMKQTEADTFTRSNNIIIENLQKTELENELKAFENTIKEEELSVDELYEYANALKETEKGLKGNASGARDVALQAAKLNKGAKTISEAFEDYKEAFDAGDVSAQGYVAGLIKVKEGAADLLGVKISDFPESFFSEENLDLLKQAAEGNAEAIKSLHLALSQNAILTIEGVADYESLDKAGKNLFDYITNMPDLEVGVTLESQQFVTALVGMMEKAGYSVEEMNKVFRQLNFSPEVGVKEVPYEMGTKVTETFTDINGVTHTVGETLTQKTVALVPTINASKTEYLGGGSMLDHSQIDTDSGSSSPAEKVDRTKKADVVNRYEEIEDKLDDIRDAADKASNAMDRLYGGDRIAEMKKQASLLKQEVGLLKDKKTEAEKYLKEDTEALAKAATEAGVRFEFDKSGNVTNYTKQMTRLYDQLAAAEAHMDSLDTKEAQDDYQETHVQSILDAIDSVQGQYDQFKETRELKEDLDAEIQEAVYTWQDANAEILNYEIELKTELNERELKKLDYYLGKMEDDFYSMAESAVLVGEKIKITNSALADSQTNFDNINELYNTIDEDTGARGMSDEAYVEALKNEQDALYDNLKTLQELDDTMMNYYGDTLSMAQDELTKYTDRLDHSTSALDHYRSLLDLTGQSQNFKAIGTVLEGQAKTIENSYQIAKENYEWLADEAIKKKQAMNDALARGDAEAAEFYENEWKAAEERMRESQDNMLSMAEEWAEKLKEVLENKLAEIADVLENALTGGLSFDELSMQMEHAQGIQEEYLATTNKIYETNKMIRNAQNEIDKTTNTVAKQKLKAFQQETQQLQNQGQLSKFELDIQQKKYDLLLAEIALEEAQNAKSAVTLQRDSEGNFGYIYTADQNQVSGAEQGVEDAENAIYNARLEGANNYASQRQKLLQELYDSLTNLDNQYYIEGTISEEEYNRQKEAIQSYYFERLAKNSELYTIATEEDAAVSQEAWSTSFGIMNKDANELMEAVDNYLINSQEAFKKYQIDINKVAEKAGVDLKNLATNVKNITDESNKLKDEVVNEVLPVLQNELDKVSEITENYALHCEELDLVMKAYEDLLEDIRNVIAEMGKLDDACDNVKTSAEQASSAIGTIGTVSPQANPNNGPNPASNHDLGEKKIFTTRTELPFKKWQKPASGLGKSYFKTEYEGKEIYVAQKGIESTVINGSVKYFAVKGAPWYEKLPQYDTGGYTGEWGPEGKLAWLHQKELVLNTSQTEDLLMTMELLDSIIKQIDMMTMNNKINQMSAAMNQAINAMYREQVAQEIHIEANFPNANDRNEIYQAFEMLANDTSQFINR